jgi:hypothetical protein
MTFRPIFSLFAKMKKAKARKASRALITHRLRNEDSVRQALIDKLCGELGRQPFKLSRRA